MASRAAKRYAMALYGLAKDAGQISVISEDIARIAGILISSPELVNFLSNYIVTREKRKKVIAELFKSRVNDLTWRLILLMEDKKRLKLLGDVCRAFPEVKRNSEGIAEASVTIPYPADAQLMDVINGKIRILAGRPAETRMIEKPALIGGLQIRIDDILYDISVKGILGRLERKTIESV